MGQLSKIENLALHRESLDRAKLIPAPACKAIIAEIEAWDVPCSLDFAKASAKILIGTYPARQLFDAATYGTAIVSVLNEYPEDVCRAAVDHITRECKFLPTRAEMLDALRKTRAETTKYIWRAKAVLKELEARQEREDYERDRKENPVTEKQVADIRRRAWA